MSDLVRLLATAIAADLREFPDGPPAEASALSATPRTRNSRSGPDRIVSGRLHPAPAGYDCSPNLRVVA
jgi:hypothetical protein